MPVDETPAVPLCLSSTLWRRRAFVTEQRCHPLTRGEGHSRAGGLTGSDWVPLALSSRPTGTDLPLPLKTRSALEKQHLAQR
ncbi:hypothetical protein GN956_G10213 [Arapaima gigas]